MSFAETADLPTRHHNEPPLKERLALEFQALVDGAEVVAARATELPREITSDDDLGPVGEVVKDARRLRSTAEARRKAEKEPYLQAGRDIDAFFATITERMDRVQSVLEQRATAWQRSKEAEERRRREEEARRLREEEERKRRIAAEEAERNRPKAAARKEAEAQAVADQAAEAEAAAKVSAADLTRVRTDAGAVATTTTRWAAEIVDYEALDLNQLRHHFARADVEKALRAFVKTHRDTRPIPGVRVYPDVRASFR